MTATPPPSSEAIHPSDRTALRVVAALALAGAVVGLVAAVAAVLAPLFGGDGITVGLFLSSDRALESAGSLAAGIQSISTDTGEVTFDPSAVGGGAIALLLIERGLSGVVAAIVAASIGYTLIRITRGEAFHRSLFAVAVTTGCALTFGMLTATALGGFGRMVAGDELNTLLGVETFAVGFLASPVPVLLGIAVLGLAYVFRIGARLQRETEGLV